MSVGTKPGSTDGPRAMTPTEVIAYLTTAEADLLSEYDIAALREAAEAWEALRAWGEARKATPEGDADHEEPHDACPGCKAIAHSWAMREAAEQLADRNDPGKPEGCWACKGAGSVEETSQSSQDWTTVACGACGGRGTGARV
jgi:hypothetical protein